MEEEFMWFVRLISTDKEGEQIVERLRLDGIPVRRMMKHLFEYNIGIFRG